MNNNNEDLDLIGVLTVIGFITALVLLIVVYIDNNEKKIEAYEYCIDHQYSNCNVLFTNQLKEKKDEKSN